MNTAERGLITWFMLDAEIDRSEVDEFLAILDEGLAKSEADAVALKDDILKRASIRANAADTPAEVKELVVLAREISALEDARAKAETLISIRGIADLPTVSVIGQRIRSNRVRELVDSLRS